MFVSVLLCIFLGQAPRPPIFAHFPRVATPLLHDWCSPKLGCSLSSFLRAQTFAITTMDLGIWAKKKVKYTSYTFSRTSWGKSPEHNWGAYYAPKPPAGFLSP